MALLEWETIDADQIDDTISGRPPRPPKPTPLAAAVGRRRPASFSARPHAARPIRHLPLHFGANRHPPKSPAFSALEYLQHAECAGSLQLRRETSPGATQLGQVVAAIIARPLGILYSRHQPRETFRVLFREYVTE